MADEEAEYTFDENAAKRIVRATKAQENRSPDRTPERRERGSSPNRRRLVEFIEDLEPGSTATAKLLERTGPGTWEAVDPEVEYTVEDDLGWTVKAGDRAWIEFQGGYWYIARLKESGDCLKQIGGIVLADLPEMTGDELAEDYVQLGLTVSGCLRKIPMGDC